MPKNRYIIANWKMNMDLKSITQWLNDFKKALPNIPEDKTVIIAPSFPYLGLMKNLLENSDFKLSAQDISTYQIGAHTGSVGSFQIKDFCDFCIIGHSELKEPLEISKQKRDLCHTQKITPIFCFAKLEDATTSSDEQTLIVWEDPESISVNGVARAKSTDKIEEDIINLRKTVAEKSVIVYGGSVNKQNVLGLSKIKGLDGILVGSASLDPTHFAELIVQF